MGPGSRALIIGDEKFIHDAELILSQLDVHIETASDEKRARKKLRSAFIGTVIFDDDVCGADGGDLRERIAVALQKSKKKFIVVSSRRTPDAIDEARFQGASDYITKPYNYREFIARFNATRSQKTRISCVGGGTGLFNLLLGLKTLPNVLLTSIVSTSDDGGSSGRLRASFGVLPPGDIRRSLVALSNAPELMNALMQYRFEKGESLVGHSFGNLILTVLAEIKGSMRESVRALGEILNIQGIVLPVTDIHTTLCALFEDKTLLKGESKIDLAEGRNPNLHIENLWHEPEPKSDMNAYASIINSEIVTIGPGDLFTSIITNLLVADIRRALQKTRAKRAYICNLMTKPGETASFTALDHVREVVKYIGGDHLDYIILSNTKLSDRALREYAKKDQVPVEVKNVDQIRTLTKAKVIIADVGHETELVRHDSMKLRDEINKIVERLRERRGA